VFYLLGLDLCLWGYMFVLIRWHGTSHLYPPFIFLSSFFDIMAGLFVVFLLSGGDLFLFPFLSFLVLYYWGFSYVYLQMAEGDIRSNLCIFASTKQVGSEPLLSEYPILRDTRNRGNSYSNLALGLN
jgi:hypothetical protein